MKHILTTGLLAALLSTALPANAGLLVNVYKNAGNAGIG